jgi:hypothetical protein
MNDSTTNPPMANTVTDDDLFAAGPKRDRIVFLGRRAAGKTVYLSVLYDRYWRALDGLTMRALSGHVHSDLVRTAEGLRRGQWPPATLETQHCDLEINYKGERYLLVALDYAGELFRRAFVEDATDTPETATLIEHIDSAAAVIILIDPSNVVGPDVDAAIDDDYGMTQAVSRIRSWPGGQDVPVVVAFTKADVTANIVSAEGGLHAFMKRRFPALARTMQKAMMFQISAAPSENDAGGEAHPKPHFQPYQIEKPLVYCLDQLQMREATQRHNAVVRQQIQAAQAQRDMRVRTEKRTNRKVAAIVAGMIVLAGCLIAIIWAMNA